MSNKDFPKTVTVVGEKYTLRLMSRDDIEKVHAFAKGLSEADLWFMRRDITRVEAIEEWIHEIESDHACTILVEHKDKLVAYGSIYYNQLFWNRHLAEMRVMVAADCRGRGVGQKLARELTLLARSMGLEKVMVYMAANDQAARRMVDYLDFKPEAILADWIKGRDNRKHDLLIMSTDLAEIQS
ncbi:MAG: N-acetyltransferase family protein [Chloroflexota bacterium]